MVRSHRLGGFVLASIGAVVVLGASSAGCGGDSDDDAGGGSSLAPDAGGARDADASSDDPVVALRVAPDRAEIDVLTGETLALRAVEQRASGAEQDVTSDVAWRTVPPSLGSVLGGVFTPSGPAGTATVTARWRGLSATTVVRLRLSTVVVEPPEPGQAELPDDPAAIISTATSSERGRPRIVYPLDGVLLPRNLGQIDVHFRPGRHELFEVSFRSPEIDVRFYTRCRPLEEGCRFDLDETLYAQIAEAAAGRAPVAVQVRGTDDEGQLVGASEVIEVSFSADPVEGGLYYWATNAESIMRVDFGAGNEPERFFPFGDTDTCFGCHALSPDGERMSLSRNGQWNGELYLLDVSSGELIMDGTTGDEEQFQSWSPDSTRFAAIYGDGDREDLHDEIRIRSGETGEILERIDLGHEPTHPDWSPRGDRIAYTRVTESNTSQRPGRGGISYIEDLGDGWSSPQTLIEPEDGLNYYNPAHAPDGSFLVFNRSVCPGGGIYGSACDADADPSAILLAISADGGPMIELERANAGGPEDGDRVDLAHTFPRWAPFVGDRRADGSGRIMWLTYSSRRRYGLHPLPEVDKSLPGQLMWMAAVDPDAIHRGEDGSFPAFALPFQDLSTSNHIGQWTRRVVPTDPDPGGGGSDAGVDAGPRCRTRGESCAAGSCCSGLVCRDRGGGPTCESSL